MDHSLERRLRAAILSIPDYPSPGVTFRDITTLLSDAEVFRLTVEAMAVPYLGRVDKVAGLEARGFIFGGAVAQRLAAGFVPIRKKGKLPRAVLRASYELEYGTDELEVHVDAVAPGERVLIIDDLIATGGTAAAAVNLLHQLQARVAAACFVVDLPELGGSQKLRDLGLDVRSLVAF